MLNLSLARRYDNGCTWLDSIEKCQSVICGECCHVYITDTSDDIGQSRQLMEVCRKQTERLDLGRNVSVETNTAQKTFVCDQKHHRYTL